MLLTGVVKVVPASPHALAVHCIAVRCIAHSLLCCERAMDGGPPDLQCVREWQQEYRSNKEYCCTVERCVGRGTPNLLWLIVHGVSSRMTRKARW